MRGSKVIQMEKPKRVEPSEWWSWGVILFLAACLVLSLALTAKAQSAQAPLPCPPDFAQCFAKVQSVSPEADRICLRKVGATGYPAANDPLCKPVPASDPLGVFSIQFPKPEFGARHDRYAVVACDDEVQLCSLPAARGAIAVALDAPSFFDVLKAAFGQ